MPTAAPHLSLIRRAQREDGRAEGKEPQSAMAVTDFIACHRRPSGREIHAEDVRSSEAWIWAATSQMAQERGNCSGLPAVGAGNPHKAGKYSVCRQKNCPEAWLP